MRLKPEERYLVKLHRLAWSIQRRHPELSVGVRLEPFVDQYEFNVWIPKDLRETLTGDPDQGWLIYNFGSPTRTLKECYLWAVSECHTKGLIK